MTKKTEKTKKRELDVVAAVQETTAQAASLAGISGQELLSDPRLNPATRPHADRLLIEQQVKALDGDHALRLRRHRVVEARADEAERTLQAIALARRASNPARSVWELHRGRRVWSRLSLAASVVLAAGSAMGVEAAAHALSAPTGTGYISEVGLTGLATAAIAYRAHLAEHQGELKPKSWQQRALRTLMTVPLLISVIANLTQLNALGAACSVGAAAFALLGAVVADRSAAAMQARANEVGEARERELHVVAMGHDLFGDAPGELATAETIVAEPGAPEQPELPAGEPGEVSEAATEHPAVERPVTVWPIPVGERRTLPIVSRETPITVEQDGTDDADGGTDDGAAAGSGDVDPDVEPVADERLEYTGPVVGEQEPAESAPWYREPPEVRDAVARALGDDLVRGAERYLTVYAEGPGALRELPPAPERQDAPGSERPGERADEQSGELPDGERPDEHPDERADERPDERAGERSADDSPERRVSGRDTSRGKRPGKSGRKSGGKSGGRSQVSGDVAERLKTVRRLLDERPDISGAQIQAETGIPESTARRLAAQVRRERAAGERPNGERSEGERGGER